METKELSKEYISKLPNTIFKQNRDKFLNLLKTFAPEIPKGSIIIIKGKENLPIDSTDVNYESYQESNFYYLFGVQEMGFSGCIEIDSGAVTLFVPKVPIQIRVSNNSIRKAEVAKKYEVNAFYETNIQVFVESLNPVILVLL